MLIDQSYFKGLLNIGDIALGNSPVVGNTVTTTFIPLYEEQYLKKALGITLYTAFIAGLDEDPIPQKWADLKNGVVYEYNGRECEWQGFVNSNKVSPIANYVYCEYVSATAVSMTNAGAEVANKQNATVVPVSFKIQRAWSDMLTMTDSLFYFLHAKHDDYDWSYHHHCAQRHFGLRNSFGI